jgi:fermentation-respiration switch protein FrsA (DUF1100 family)
LLQKLGIDSQSIGFKEEQRFENIDKIKTFSKPCLVIHAQFDHIIPFSDGQALFDACASSDKMLLEIKGANHNDIFLRGTGANTWNILKGSVYSIAFFLVIFFESMIFYKKNIEK